MEARSMTSPGVIRAAKQRNGLSTKARNWWGEVVEGRIVWPVLCNNSSLVAGESWELGNR
jgi:hypothetical protein